MSTNDRRFALIAGLLLALGTPVGLASASPDHHAPAKPTAKPKAKPAPKTEPSHAEKPAPKPAHSGHGTTEAKTDSHVIETAPPATPAHTAPAAKQPEPSYAAEPQADGHAVPAAASARQTATAEQALAWLNEGNARWVAGEPTAPNTDSSRRSRTATEGQFPFVTIITCADSRCPVERIFDRGVGDVFVARVAGNVIDPHTAGTVEYGVEHLHTPLIVIMGHTSCGAVKAAASGARPGHNIDVLLDDIAPAVARARSANPEAQGDQFVNAAVRENVFQSMFDLFNTSPLTARMVADKNVKLVGAVYDMETGRVSFVGEHPWQDQLVQAVLSRPAAHPAAETAPTATETASAEPAGHADHAQGH